MLKIFGSDHLHPQVVVLWGDYCSKWNNRGTGGTDWEMPFKGVAI